MKHYGTPYVVKGSIHEIGTGRFAVLVCAVEQTDRVAPPRSMAKKSEAPNLESAQSLRHALSLELANELVLHGHRVVRVEKEAETLR